MKVAAAQLGWVALMGLAVWGVGCSAGARGQGSTGKGVAAATEGGAVRERVSFNDGWRFVKGDPEGGAADALPYATLKPYLLPGGNRFVKGEGAVRPEGGVGEQVAYTQAGFDDSGWRKLDLPHDWGIEGPFKQEYDGDTGKLPWWGVAWYRKHFTVPSADAGKKVFLDIDGAMSYSAVWVNGKFAGGWPYGYASYRVDLTPYLKVGGENVVAIRLDNPKDSSRWYPGGGIYRNTWLVKTNEVHVGQWGTYVTTPRVTPGEAEVKIAATVDNDGGQAAEVGVRTRVHEADADGRPVGKAVAEMGPAKVQLDPGKQGEVAGSVTVKSPKLWDVKSPHRYVAVTTVERGGKVIDTYETPFGIRTIAFDKDNGFLLNGKRVEIQGVCNHHDLGPLGAALNVRALERQIQILQEMGCNAIRTSHNPPAPELLELCDRMGMLVMDESFDCWALAKRPNDYSLLFPDWHERDWRAELRRDRNHPSIIIWSIGNELKELRQDKQGGQKIAAELTRIAHEEDPTRPTSFACNVVDAGYNGFQKTVDIFGYNYKPTEYGKFREKNPTIPLYGSETSSCVSTRGEYFFPVSNDKSKGQENYQVSSYDLYAPRWAWPPDVEFTGLDKYPFTAGEFVWTGFDYLGEPTPYNKDVTNLLNFSDPAERAKAEQELKELGKLPVPSRSSYFGIVDLVGFKKDRFYIYQARWRPELPMAHILPHWNWPERVGQVTPVHVYTSGDEAELFLNGKSLGKKQKGKLEYRLRWDDVKYEPGELKVVAYKGGKKWAEDTVKTTGAAVKLKATPDRKAVHADGKDLSFVTIAVTDKDGLTVPRTNNMLHFSVDGPGEIVAVDNGDPTSHQSFQSHDYTAFNGLCMVIVRTKAGQTGKITLHVRGDGVQGTEAQIVSR